MRTTRPCLTRRSWQISRCSRVWGMTPSSAAMTRATRSMPEAPATMWRTKRSCPGTSTMPRCWPEGSVRSANPSSMVIPRSFSSLRRSGSTPVRAFIRALLPWSICPAVPKMMGAVVMGSCQWSVVSVSRVRSTHHFILVPKLYLGTRIMKQSHEPCFTGVGSMLLLCIKSCRKVYHLSQIQASQ